MIYRFLINDFVTAWDAVAHEHHAVGRGNFIFGRHVMAMLEWAARLCWSDTTDAALRDWSAALHANEPKYFTGLPGPCADTREFQLPGLPVSVPQEQLLWALFDLVRHGLGHQHLPIGVDLPGGGVFAIGVTGANFGLCLAESERGIRSAHLDFVRQANVLAITVRPDVMFQDLRRSIDAAGLLGRGLRFQYLARPRPTAPPLRPDRPSFNGPRYEFTLDQLESALRSAGHAPNLFVPDPQS